MCVLHLYLQSKWWSHWCSLGHAWRVKIINERTIILYLQRWLTRSVSSGELHQVFLADSRVQSSASHKTESHDPCIPYNINIHTINITPTVLSLHACSKWDYNGRKRTLSLRESCSVVCRVPCLWSTLASLSGQAHSAWSDEHRNCLVCRIRWVWRDFFNSCRYSAVLSLQLTWSMVRTDHYTTGLA